MRTGLRPVPRFGRRVSRPHGGRAFLGNPKGSSALAGALKRAPILGECGMDHEARPSRGPEAGLHLYLQVLKVPSAPPSSLLAVPPHPSLGCAGLQNPLPNGLSPRGNALPRPPCPCARLYVPGTGVRGHPRPGSPKPHEGQPPKAVKGLVLPLHPRLGVAGGQEPPHLRQTGQSLGTRKSRRERPRGVSLTAP